MTWTCLLQLLSQGNSASTCQGSFLRCFYFVFYWLGALGQGNSADTCQGTFLCCSALTNRHTIQVRSSHIKLKNSWWTGEEKLLSVDPKDSCEAHLDVEDEGDWFLFCDPDPEAGKAMKSSSSSMNAGFGLLDCDAITEGRLCPSPFPPPPRPPPPLGPVGGSAICGLNY